MIEIHEITRKKTSEGLGESDAVVETHWRSVLCCVTAPSHRTRQPATRRCGQVRPLNTTPYRRVAL